MPFDPNACDPHEIVTAPYLTAGPIELRAAVRETMAKLHDIQESISIFRPGIPSILSLREIKDLAECVRFNFQDNGDLK